jgi:hypothetical protein
VDKPCITVLQVLRCMFALDIAGSPAQVAMIEVDAENICLSFTA